MSLREMPALESTVIMDGAAMQAHIERLAALIAEEHGVGDNLVLLGILRRGKPLAERLARHLGEITGYAPPVGALATTLYRDDAHRIGALPAKGQTHFSFSLDDRTVLLVDDVLAAGRTIRAAMEEVMDYGRPRRIQLACLVDRGGRELPIQPDFLGWEVATKPNEWVAVHLQELDGEDLVLLEKRAPDGDAAEASA